MSPLQPWTQEFVVRWRPELRYYERRYNILRALQDAGKLSGFRETGQRTMARLGDRWHQITFGPDRVECEMLRPDADRAALVDALHLVLRELEPARVGSPTAKLQYVIPQEGSYDEVRHKGARAVLGTPGAAQVWDLACLIDVKVADPVADLQAEFGIVESSEIAPRLARTVGRLRDAAMDRPPAVLPGLDVPDVAFFCDTQWVIEERLAAEDVHAAVDDLWKRVVARSDEIVEHFCRRMVLSESQ